MAAFVAARDDNPLFAADIAGAFSETVAEAWLIEVSGGKHPEWRVVDPHLNAQMGALIVATEPREPYSAWGEVLRHHSESGLYALALREREAQMVSGG